MSNSTLLSSEPNKNWSPRHLQAMAYLYGLKAPNMTQASILELGCGTGENLLPIAHSYPQAQITGIDIDDEKTQLGQAHITQQKLTNLQLYTADINVLLNSQLEKYDYILIRGLFSQTDLATRTTLLNHCQQHLNPNGIICIGYDVYPGSKLNDGLYEALAFHAAQATTEEEQVDSMKSMQAFMLGGMSSKHPLAKQLESSLEKMSSKTDEQLYVESFAGLHNPCYFVEFANTLAEANLCYVGDAKAHTEIPKHWGDNTAELYAAINPTKQKILGQQYLDFVCGRSTRMSILTHQHAQPLISAEPQLERLMDLRWAGYFERVEEDSNACTNNHKTANGEYINTKNPATLTILDALGYVYPFSLDANHLLINTRTGLEIINNDTDAFDNLEQSLEAIFTYLGNKVHLSCTETAYDLSNDNQLTVLAPLLAKNQFNDNHTYINLWHEVVQNINPSSIDELLKDIRKQFTKPYVLPEGKNEALKEKVIEIDQLRKTGILLGSNQAWQEYYNSTFRQLVNDNYFADKRVLYLLLFNFPHLINSHFISDKECSESREPTQDELNDFAKHQDLPLTEFRSYVDKSDENIKNLHVVWNEVLIKQVNTHTVDSNQSILNALALNPILLDQYNFFTLLCVRLYKHLNQVTPILQRTLELDPENGHAWSILADYASYYQQNHEAEQLLKQALKYSPESEGVKIKLANNYSVLGEHEKAIEIYESYINLEDIGCASMFSNYLFSLIHTNIYSPEKLFELHKDYGRLVTKWADQQNWHKEFNNPLTTDRPLRIGFVSGDLRFHPVTKFLMPYWEGLDKNKFHIYAYSTHPVHDKTSDRLEASAKNWKNVVSLNSLELAKTIHEDQIDILIDLSGHTGYNSLPAFALKPAPVQMTWIGYPATTGLRQMDYKLTSAAYAELDWMQEQFTERLLYMNVVPAFDNTVKLPAITKQMPYEKNSYFTFASFNRPQKISNEVLKTWAEIMQLCPNDKLLIANMPDEETTTSFKEKLINFGAKEEQLLFKKRVGIDEYMEMHNEVDLLLDTFPYNGGTTTFHAISMGVATVALAGKSAASHPNIFYIYQLEEFLASNTENYKAKALLWRQNSEKLLILKKKLRAKFEETSLNKNAKNESIKSFSNLLKYAWENYLANGAAKSAIISSSSYIAYKN